MTRTNVDTTRAQLTNRPEVEQVSVDGDTATEEAVFRLILADGVTDDFEQFVASELGVEITRTKWVVFGKEVVLR